MWYNMPYNKKFDLTPKELDLVEIALIAYSTKNVKSKKEIQKLLAKFHHQKRWYRPKDETYISG
jgi:hypothetical protein